MEEKNYTLSEEAQDVLNSIPVEIDIEKLIDETFVKMQPKMRETQNNVITGETVKQLIEELEYSGIQATWQDFKGWLNKEEHVKEPEQLTK